MLLCGNLCFTSQWHQLQSLALLLLPRQHTSFDHLMPSRLMSQSASVCFSGNGSISHIWTHKSMAPLILPQSMAIKQEILFPNLTGMLSWNRLPCFAISSLSLTSFHTPSLWTAVFISYSTTLQMPKLYLQWLPSLIDNFSRRYHVPSPKSWSKKQKLDSLPRYISAHFLHTQNSTKTIPFPNVKALPKSSHHEDFGNALTFGCFGSQFSA